MVQTAVIRVNEPAKDGSGYIIELFVWDGVTPPPALVSLARATIPLSLIPATIVDDPEHPGTALTVSRVESLYAQTSDASNVFEPIGRFLYELLMQGDIGTEWNRRVTAALAPVGATMRTIIDIAAVPSLARMRALPWEIMCDGNASRPFLHQRHVMLRGLELDQATSVLPEKFATNDWPLRVLVVFGADNDFADGVATNGIGASNELREIETMFARSRFDVELEVLEHPAINDILEKCREIEPHILHFICHGNAGPLSDDHELLLWSGGSSATGQYLSWSMHDMRRDLEDVPIRFVFLNACRSAAAQNAGGTTGAVTNTLPFASLAESFLDLGALGVIGMQGNIPGDLASEFSRTFYQTLVSRARPLDALIPAVDIAVQTARLAMSRLRTRYAQHGEWSYPVLTTRVWPEHVLPTLPAKFDAKTAIAERFVARVGARRLVRESAGGPGTHRKPIGSGGLVVLTGGSGTGKSHLARWCTQLCRHSGLREVYIALSDGDKVDLLDLIRWIRDGNRPLSSGAPAERVAEWPLSAEMFDRFNWTLNHKLEGYTLVPEFPGTSVTDSGKRMTSLLNLAPNFFEQVLDSFCHALAKAAEPSGLVLVIDPVDRIESATLNDWLVKNFFARIARGEVPRVYLVLIGGDNDRFDLLGQLDKEGATYESVKVERFKNDDFEKLARQLCLQWSPDVYESARVNFPQIRKREPKEGPWSANLLKTVNDICKAFGDS